MMNQKKNQLNADPVISLLQVFVFKHDNYLGWDCFEKSKVSIGTSSQNDLFLDDEVDVPFEFEIEQIDHKLFIHNTHQKGIIRINGKPVVTSVLNPLDVITIGPYSLKTKLKNSGTIHNSDIPQKLEKPENSDEVSDRKDDTVYRKNQDEKSENPILHQPNENLFPVKPRTGKLFFQVADMALADIDLESEEHLDQIEQDIAYIAGNTGKFETLLPTREIPEIQSKAQPNDTADKREVLAKTEQPDLTPDNSYDIHDQDDDSQEDIIIETDWDEDLDKNKDSGKDHVKADRNAGISTARAMDEGILEEEDPAQNSEGDEDDEDREVTIDPFLAKHILGSNSNKVDTNSDHVASEGLPESNVLEIIKSKKGQLVDVRFLDRKRKYFIVHNKKRFCLARHHKDSRCYAFVSEMFDLNMECEGDTFYYKEQLLTDQNLFYRRKKIYRIEVPPASEVYIKKGPFEYVVRNKKRQLSPDIKDTAVKSKPFSKPLSKPWAQSLLFHVFVLILASLFISLPQYNNTDDLETRFVQLDPTDLQTKIAPSKPSVKPVEKVKSLKKKTLPKSNVKKAVSTEKPVKVASRTSKNAGGGKNGNVAKRNVNQTGILGVLSGNMGFEPDSAIAAVTNLEAVESPAVDQRNFTVGGIVGKLGDAKIEAPKVGVVNTKGKKGVLRSAGISGKGDVAALDNGSTGEKQVMGMVTAKLDSGVQVRGGMSRSAVKRIIDQHLDEISSCYENALIGDPGISGRIVFEWKILLNGKVTEVRIKSSSISSPQIHGCIRDSIETWKFPKPKGNTVIVSYPFIFDVIGF